MYVRFETDENRIHFVAVWIVHLRSIFARIRMCTIASISSSVKLWCGPSWWWAGCTALTGASWEGKLCSDRAEVCNHWEKCTRFSKYSPFIWMPIVILQKYCFRYIELNGKSVSFCLFISISEWGKGTVVQSTIKTEW